MDKRSIMGILLEKEGEEALKDHCFTKDIARFENVEAGTPVTILLLDQKVTLQGTVTRTEELEERKGSRIFCATKIFFEVQETIQHIPGGYNPPLHLFSEERRQADHGLEMRTVRILKPKSEQKQNNCPMVPDNEDAE